VVLNQSEQFFRAPLAEIRGDVGLRTTLNELRDRLRAGGLRQRAEFLKIVFEVLRAGIERGEDGGIAFVNLVLFCG